MQRFGSLILKHPFRNLVTYHTCIFSYKLRLHLSCSNINQACTVNPAATTSGKTQFNLNTLCPDLSKCSLNSPLALLCGQVISRATAAHLWGYSENETHTAAPPPYAQLYSKHLKTSQSLLCRLLYQRAPGNLSESSPRYSRGPSSASMQITSAHRQLFCCYLL